MAGFGGFSAYAKIDPFAAAKSSGNPFANLGSDSGGVLAERSPRSPKTNPFSTTNPAHNPFMSFVEQKEDYWKMMSTKPSLAATSAIFGFGSETVKNTALNALTSSNLGVPVKFGEKPPVAIASDVSVSHQSDSKPAPSSPCSSDGEDGGGAESPKSDIGDTKGANPSVNNGEEGEECVLQMRAKLFRLVSVDANDAKANAGAGAITGDRSDGDLNNGINRSPSVVAVGDVSSEADRNSEEKKSEIKSVVKGRDSGGDGKSAASSVKRAEWIEVGTGPLRVLKPAVAGSDTASASPLAYPRIVMRRESQPGGHGTKLILNELLQGRVDVSKNGEKALQLTVISVGSDSKIFPKSYLLKLKHPQVRLLFFWKLNIILRVTPV